MKRINTAVLVLALSWTLKSFSCNSYSIDHQDDTSGGSGEQPHWSIPLEQVYDGGVGKDGIHAISNPEFAPIEEISYIKDNDLVIGVRFGDIVRAYPHKILNWHEIVNDIIGEHYISVNYSPLTGSGFVWNRDIDGHVTTFGVSGLLYNSNLILYDRLTDSNWSQILGECVSGVLIGTPAQTFPSVETTWSTWKAMFPESQVLTTETGYPNDYQEYPYINLRGEDYRINEYLIFPISCDDPRLMRKQRVLGIISNEEAKVYPLSVFPSDIAIINDDFLGLPIVAAGSSGLNFMIAFERSINDTLLTFTPIQHELPVIMIDNEGTVWDVFGMGISGPRAGQELTPASSFISYWFALGTFFHEPEIYQ